MDGGAWWAAVHGVTRSLPQLSNFTFTFHFHALEKEMATHSSILVWRIPRTGVPNGLPSMGLQSRTRLKRLSSSSSSSLENRGIPHCRKQSMRDFCIWYRSFCSGLDFCCRLSGKEIQIESLFGIHTTEKMKIK